MTLRTFSLVVLVLVAGCGSGTVMGTVSGTVTFKGEKVPSGTVTFVFPDKVVQAEIQAGWYEVKGVPQGEAIVTVSRLDPKVPDPYEAFNKVRMQMKEKKVNNPKEIDPKIVTDPVEMEAIQKKRHLLPLSYSSPDTSGLRCPVVGGTNTFNITLMENP
jgi:hypothetical protein